MIFSTKNILESSNNTLNTKNDIIDNNYDICFFSESLDMILNEQLVFETSLSYIEEGIAGSIIAHVAKKQIDKLEISSINDLFSKILEWFCDCIKKLSDMFLVGLSRFINANHRINMYKNKMKNMGQYCREISFGKNIELPEYSFMDNSYSSFTVEVNKVYDNLIQKLSTLNSVRNNMDLEGAISSMVDSSEIHLDIVRGNSIGSSRAISSSDYPSALYDYFRPRIINNHYITLAQFNNYYTDYFNYRDTEKKIKAESKKVELDTKAMKKKINSTKISDYTGETELDLKVKKEYSNLISNKCREVQDICNIYIQLYSAKLDALKEYNKLCQKILNIAIDTIIVAEKREGVKNDK